MAAELAIPNELRALRQFVVWRYEPRDGKPTKVPYQPASSTARASVTDPATWDTFDEAVAAATEDGVNGIGFVFTAEDPFTGVDFDDCVQGEAIDPNVERVIGYLDSYSEISPSGTGVHTIIRASLNGGRCRTGKTPWGGEFENYDKARFFCMTGRHLPATPTTVNERQAQIEQVRARILPDATEGHAQLPATTPAATTAPVGDDRDLLERARQASDGADFDALYNGQHSYTSRSEADLALCGWLAFWTGPDPARIDRLFRGSGLMRAKWDEKRGDSTYGAQTIETALAGRSEFYGERPSSATVQQPKPQAANGASTSASAIKPRRIRWAWRGRLALGYLSLWSGESSLGKSTFACWLIAELTHGRLDGHLHGKPATVLIVASEDAREDMWVPRLMVAGADLDRVQFQDHTRDWNLRDGMALTATALDYANAKLVFIDSVLEHMPEPKSGESINSSTFIRRALGPFADLCKTRHVSGLVSTHPPKSKGSTFADNVIASAAFVHMTRVGLLFAWHPHDLDLPDQERRRVLMRPPGGSNIGRDPGTHEFRVQAKDLLIEGETEEVPHVTAIAPSDVTYRDLTRTPKEDTPARTRIADARALIDERLADGHWHPSMIDELIELGFSKSTAYRAAELCEKKQSSIQEWWWAAQGTPKDTFVEVERDVGTARARARSNSQRGNSPPEHTENGSTQSYSQVPTEFDENQDQRVLAEAIPTSQTTPRARAHAREGTATLADQAEALYCSKEGS